MNLLSRFKPEPKSPEQKKELRTERFLLIVSGLLFALSFPPSPLPFLSFIALVPLLKVLSGRKTTISVNRAVYLFGFIASIATLYWVSGIFMLSDYFLLIAGGVLLFVNPVFFMIPATLFHKVSKRWGVKVGLLFFPLFWVFYEYMYMFSDLAFPWLTFGNAVAYFQPFVQIADIVGVLGISLIIVFVNVFIFKGIEFYQYKRKLDKVSFAIVLLLLAIPSIYGIISLVDSDEKGGTLAIGIIQPNLDPYDKWSGGSPDELLELYISLSKMSVMQGAKIVLWPETALPLYLLSDNYPTLVDSIHKFTDTYNVALITGMPHLIWHTGDSIPTDAKKSMIEGTYYTTYNSVLLFQPGEQQVQFYGKQKLVPFGERVPFVDAIPMIGNLLRWGVGIGGWNVGKNTNTLNISMDSGILTKADTLKVGAMICYESIFPLLSADFANIGAEFLVVATNDSWYGNSSGPYQHKAASILRAIETRKPVLRAANGGISAFIDRYGRTYEASQMYEQTILINTIVPNSEQTFYTKTPLLIPLTVTITSFLTILLLFALRFRKNTA